MELCLRESRYVLLFVLRGLFGALTGHRRSGSCKRTIHKETINGLRDSAAKIV